MENKVVAVLNRALEADRNAMVGLIKHRCACNEALADDPTIPVRTEQEGSFSVSMLGIINGIVKELGLKKIAAEYVDGGELVRFCEYEGD